MTAPTRLASKAVGYRVLHSRRLGAPTGPAAYGPFLERYMLRAVEIHEALAPDYPRAKAVVDLATQGVYAWRWRELLAMDDRVLFTSMHPEPKDRECPFAGFVHEVQWEYGADDEECVVTACGNSFRLHRDVIVYGRHIECPDGTVRRFAGLPCSFNAGGRPNRAPRWCLGGIWSTPVFTYDGDAGAAWWSAADALVYLMWRYNADETWIANATLTDADRARTEPVIVSVDGMDLWSALAAVADRGGYDGGERIVNDPDKPGEPRSTIAIVYRHAGTARTVRRQAPGGAAPTDLDLRRTNLFAARVAESTTSCITAPLVAGGRPIYEITVALQPAWDPAKLAGVAAADVILPGAGGGTAGGNQTYARRYCTSGDQFHLYAGVMRLWDANTDDLYSDEPYGLTRTDVAALVGEVWPAMPHRPLPMLTRIQSHANGPRMRTFLEFTLDGGGNWYPLAGYRVSRDRLGVWLSMENPASVAPAAAAGIGLAVSANLAAKLITDPTDVSLRLTCSIAGLSRYGAAPARRATAGTHFSQRAWFDRGRGGQVRTRTSTSRFAGLLVADEVTATQAAAEMDAIARQVQDVAEDRLIEASLPIEWPDEALHLTDVVTRIEGIEYDLGINAGAAVRFPRIVGREIRLTPGTHSMAVSLDTDRMMGVT